ncbi:MAG: phosphotransferase [Oscillospiraceae bacterium]|jgi:aminoglycoside phosphotransferase (APT) family kinase protein|nr:phosphotransferase [Oscillospiraceae bacterium]
MREDVLSRFDSAAFIDKGWSSDDKYIVTRGGETLLLRVSDIAELERKRTEFAAMQKCAETGILMNVPLELFTDEGSVYTLLTYIDGDDAQNVLPALSDAEQYALGVSAGEILRKIHAIPAPSAQDPWNTRFNRKVDRNIRWYGECPQKPEGGDAFLRYLADNRHLLDGRPQTFQHGDYHIGNMVVTPHGDLGIIDFNRLDYGDPWEEFNRIAWCAQASGAFASGRVDGYFGGDVPLDFWRLLAFYLASNALASVYWAIPFGQGEIDVMLQQASDVLTWYDGMRNIVPTWYAGGKNG